MKTNKQPLTYSFIFWVLLALRTKLIWLSLSDLLPVRIQIVRLVLSLFVHIQQVHSHVQCHCLLKFSICCKCAIMSTHFRTCIKSTITSYTAQGVHDGYAFQRFLHELDGSLSDDQLDSRWCCLEDKRIICKIHPNGED